jgi:hypothetical protein
MRPHWRLAEPIMSVSLLLTQFVALAEPSFASTNFTVPPASVQGVPSFSS